MASLRRLLPWVPRGLFFAWFAVSAIATTLFAAHLRVVLAFGFPLLGRGVNAPAAGVGLGLSLVSAATALALIWGRPLVRRLGAVLALAEMLVSLFFAVLPVEGAFLAFLYVRVVLDGILLWMATAKGAPLQLPRVNRDLITVLFVVVASVLLLGRIYGATILQYLIGGFVVGSIYVLGATGLSLIFGIRKFANFAHGEMVTFGAYMALWINAGFAANLVYGVAFALVATAGLAMVLELLVFRKLAGKGPVSLLVASIGVTIFLNNLINVSFGTSIQKYDVRVAVSWVLLEMDGVPVLLLNPLKGVATLVACLILILFLHLLLSRTTLGKAMRATADNPDLARASGINTRNVVLWTWAIAGGLAATAGVLLGIVNDVRPGMGFNILLFVFAAVIVGGLGSPYGAMLGGFVVGIAQEMSVPFLAWLGRPDVLGIDQAVAYKPVAAFMIMILVLLLRPEGLVSGKGTTGRRWGGQLRQLVSGERT